MKTGTCVLSKHDRALGFSRHFVLMAVIFSVTALCVGSVAADGRQKNDHKTTMGFVGSLTNAPEGNEIVLYDRAQDGTLRLVDSFPTGGLGDPQTREVGFWAPADALGSQNPLISTWGNCVVGVNPGSDSIFAGRVGRFGSHNQRTGFVLKAVVDSGGQFPVSLTTHGHLLYVLNSGGAGNITGFTIGHGCHLTPLEGSTRSLDFQPEDLRASPPFFLISPAQVQFSPNGRWLVVTVKGARVENSEPTQTNAIHVFTIDNKGLPSERSTTSMSIGFTPFGIGFARNLLVIAEAFGTALEPPPPPTEGAGAVSSYAFAGDGSLIPLSRSISNGQTATCWVAISFAGHYAYVTNNGSSTISGYRVDPHGGLTLLDSDGVTAETGLHPVDLNFSRNGRFLYTLNAGAGTISAYRINYRTGALTFLEEVPGLPANDGAVGLVAR